MSELNNDNLKALREKLNKLRQKYEAEREQSLQKEAEAQKANTDAVLLRLYNNLRARIYSSCGLDAKVKFHLDLYAARDPAIQASVKERSGIEYTVNEDDKDYCLASLSGEWKSVEVLENVCGNQNVRMLNFDELLQENNNRSAFWREFLPEFAKQCVDISHTCLEEMPDKFYGILERVTIVQNGRTAFGGEFQFNNLRIEYSYLTNTQRTELTAAMNALVSHGKFSLNSSKYSSETLWVYLEKSGRIVEDCYFDYEEFYRQYDVVTPELQQVFDHIIQNLELHSVDEQYQALQPSSKLVYWFNKGELIYEVAKSHFTVNLHAGNLLEAVNESLDGIHVKQLQFRNREERWASPRGCAHGVNSYDERIEFDCEVRSPDCELAAKMVKIEQEIAKFKLEKENRNYFADSIIDNVIEIIDNKTKKCYSATEIIEWLSQRNTAPKEEFAFYVYDYVTDLEKIKDKDFLNLVAEDVSKRSGGLIKVSLTDDEHLLGFEICF